MIYRIPGVHCSMKRTGENHWELTWFTKEKQKWARQLSVIRSINGAYFDAAAKKWIVTDGIASVLSEQGWATGTNNINPVTRNPIESLVPIKYKEYALKPEIIPDYVPEDRQRELIDSVELDESRMLIPGLREYQVDFIKFAGIKGGRVALMDDMGTGKTLQSLAWITYADAFPALIVVNAPTKLQWEREFKRWVGKVIPDVKVKCLFGKSTKNLEKDCSYIINWDILSSWEMELKKNKFKCIIGDEAQAIGNPDSQRAKSFLRLAKIIPQCIVMSGTPARSKTMQFWSMLQCVDPNLFPNYTAYKWRYCGPVMTNWGLTFDGSSNVKELHALMVSCSLRRTKSQVMKFLPAKTIQVVPVEVTKEEIKAWKEEAENILQSGDGSKLSEENKIKTLMRSSYVLKKDRAIDWIKNFVETSDEKLLVFAWHINVVEDLYDALKEYNPAKIYGATSSQEREVEKSKFANDKTCRIIIGNIQSLGTGVDGLQNSCGNVAFIEFPYSSTDLDQAIDRLHRGGQEKPVTAHLIVAPGTIDDKVVEVLDDRRKMMASVMDGQEVDSSDLITELLKRL